MKMYFDCSKSKNLDYYDFESTEEYGSSISILDFYDKYLDKNLQNFILNNSDSINKNKVILDIKFVNHQLNELKFDKIISRLIKV